MSAASGLHPPRRARLLLRLSRPAISIRVDRRGVLAFVIAGLVTLVAVGVTLTIGEYPVPLGAVLRAIVGTADPSSELVIRVLRLPRLLAALFVGASLGMSGAIFQGLTQNPLVSPDIIGINSGASVAVVVAVVVGGGGPPPALFALTGALTAAAVVYLLSLGRGVSRFRLVLIGVGVNAVLGAVITYLLTQASLNQVLSLNHYLLGDVSGTTWPTVRSLVSASVPLMALGVGLGSQFEILQLGDSVATGVGARVGRSRLLLMVVGIGLAAVAVTAAGPVGFVAFIAPHIARRLARGPGASVLPVSAAIGGALVVVADYAAQRLFEPTQLPVGILTVVIAGPYFMVLLLRAARAGML